MYSISYSSENFKISEEGEYKEGKKDGKWIAYYSGGKPFIISHYKEGKLNGIMQNFSRRGKIISEINYKEGVKNGKFILYNKNGKVIKQYNFKDGIKLDGEVVEPNFSPIK